MTHPNNISIKFLPSIRLFALIFTPLLLHGGDVAPSATARILRVVSSSSGTENKVACYDAEIASELKNIGIEIDLNAKVAWASNERDLKTLISAGHLVVCGKQSFLSKGAGIAVALEGGRPVIYVNMNNIKSSNTNVPDSILKIAKVQP